MAKSIIQTIRLNVQRLMLRRQGVVIHNNTIFVGVNFLGTAIIEPYCRLIGDPDITIGRNFYMNSGCHLLGEINIGDDVLIGPKTVIWGRDHGIARSNPIREQPHVRAPIIIGDDVWISANVTILKGVYIGKGAVIGAGTVVIKDVPEYAILVGNPARIVKYRE